MEHRLVSFQARFECLDAHDTTLPPLALSQLMLGGDTAKLSWVVESLQ